MADIVGGYTDAERTTPYTSDHLQMVFSVSKAVLALCYGVALDRGMLDLDHPVVDYWPGFGAAGKAGITVRQLLGHRAGLPAFSVPTTVNGLLDRDARLADLVSQAPAWTPGTAHGYHGVTIGFLAGELFRRTTGVTDGAFLASEFSQPLGVDAWFGAPEDVFPRVIRHQYSPAAADVTEWLNRNASTAPDFVKRNASIPGASLEEMDQPIIWASDIPSLSLVSNARSIAKLFSTATDGPNRKISEQTISDMTRPVSEGFDQILQDQRTRFATLFQLEMDGQPLLGPTSFAHTGAAGALGFADTDSGIAFCYVGNRADKNPTPHARVSRILRALRANLA